VADSLVKSGFSSNVPCRIFNSIPVFISNSLLRDARCVTFPLADSLTITQLTSGLQD